MIQVDLLGPFLLYASFFVCFVINKRQDFALRINKNNDNSASTFSLWASYLTSLCLSFLFYKMVLITVPSFKCEVPDTRHLIGVGYIILNLLCNFPVSDLWSTKAWAYHTVTSALLLGPTDCQGISKYLNPCLTVLFPWPRSGHGICIFSETLEWVPAQAHWTGKYYPGTC